ncbi:MAG TPA: hypothetical protein VFG81_11145 [Anaerolineales bacterium]|nr:hypothetical protein [Anaerolineales bacterium]
MPCERLAHFLDQGQELALLDHGIDMGRRLDLAKEQPLEPLQLLRGKQGWIAKCPFPVRLPFFIRVPVIRSFLLQGIDNLDLLLELDAAEPLDQGFKILLPVPEAAQGRFGLLLRAGQRLDIRLHLLEFLPPAPDLVHLQDRLQKARRLGEVPHEGIQLVAPRDSLALQEQLDAVQGEVSDLDKDRGGRMLDVPLVVLRGRHQAAGGFHLAALCNVDHP